MVSFNNRFHSDFANFLDNLQPVFKNNKIDAAADLLNQIRDKLANELVPHIPFNQDELPKLNYHTQKTLLQLAKRVDGLCEPICNYVLKEDLIGKGKDASFLKRQITLEKLDNDNIKRSHILDVYSLFHKIIAFLFGIYQDSIFSWRDQWKLVEQKTEGDKKVCVVQREILSKNLQKISDGETLKLHSIKKVGFKLRGHTVLIKKIQDDNYTLFDPDNGEHRKLSMNDLCNRIDAILKVNKGTDMTIIKGTDFLRRWNPT